MWRNCRRSRLSVVDSASNMSSSLLWYPIYKSRGPLTQGAWRLTRNCAALNSRRQGALSANGEDGWKNFSGQGYGPKPYVTLKSKHLRCGTGQDPISFHETLSIRYSRRSRFTTSIWRRWYKLSWTVLRRRKASGWFKFAFSAGGFLRFIHKTELPARRTSSSYQYLSPVTWARLSKSSSLPHRKGIASKRFRQLWHTCEAVSVWIRALSSLNMWAFCSKICSSISWLSRWIGGFFATDISPAVLLWGSL